VNVKFDKSLAVASLAVNMMVVLPTISNVTYSFRDGMAEILPTVVECTAIERIEGMFQSCADALLREVQALEDRQLPPESVK